MEERAGPFNEASDRAIPGSEEEVRPLTGQPPARGESTPRWGSSRSAPWGAWRVLAMLLYVVPTAALRGKHRCHPRSADVDTRGTNNMP